MPLTTEPESRETMFSFASRWLLDTVFPLFCVGCEAPGAWLCHACRQTFPRRTEQRCPVCVTHPTPWGERCFSCPPSAPLDGVFAASLYHSPILSHAIHDLKYRFLPGLAEPLGCFLAENLERTALVPPDALVPVPLHSRRLRERGFNQAELLAQTVARVFTPELALPVEVNLLKRTRATKPQMKTRSKEERLDNLTGAFALDPDGRQQVRGKRLWLVDDVSTTGTTLRECAQVLKAGGAQSVFGIVLAR